MPQRHPCIVAYDIPRDSRRRAAFRIAMDYALERQHSVFECPIDARAEQEMLGRLREIVDPDEDRVLLARTLDLTPRLLLGRACHRAVDGLIYVG